MDYPSKPTKTDLPSHKGDVYYAKKAYDTPPSATAVPIINHQAPTTPLATPYSFAPEVAAPMTPRSLCFRTIMLIPYHLFNFVLGTVGFCVEVTCVSLAAGLLPLCLLGIPIYIGTLHLTRLLTIADVALANWITPAHATVRLDVPDAEDRDDPHMYGAHELRVAPKLTRVSVRSTLVVLYFATVKFVLGIASIVAVSLPLQPIASQIVASNTRPDQKSHVAGWEVHAFNFSTHPVAYAFTCIGYIIGGAVLIHVFGIASRETTRYVCCSKPKGSAVALAGEV